jgi:hypothetical protein
VGSSSFDKSRQAIQFGAGGGLVRDTEYSSSTQVAKRKIASVITGLSWLFAGDGRRKCHSDVARKPTLRIMHV